MILFAQSELARRVALCQIFDEPDRKISNVGDCLFANIIKGVKLALLNNPGWPALRRINALDSFSGAFWEILISLPPGRAFRQYDLRHCAL
jgi:hypothetical protein